MTDLWHIVQANSNFSSKELKVYIIPLPTERKCEWMNKESKKGRMADALALGGDEGRDKLR